MKENGKRLNRDYNLNSSINVALGADSENCPQSKMDAHESLGLTVSFSLSSISLPVNATRRE